MRSVRVCAFRRSEFGTGICALARAVMQRERPAMSEVLDQESSHQGDEDDASAQA
jgi:hypothetical protein